MQLFNFGRALLHFGTQIFNFGRKLFNCGRIEGNVIASNESERNDIETGENLDKEIKFNREVKFVSSTGR